MSYNNLLPAQCRYFHFAVQTSWISSTRGLQSGDIIYLYTNEELQLTICRHETSINGTGRFSPGLLAISCLTWLLSRWGTWTPGVACCIHLCLHFASCCKELMLQMKGLCVAAVVFLQCEVQEALQCGHLSKSRKKISEDISSVALNLQLSRRPWRAEGDIIA